MSVRLRHVKRVRAKGRTYWYHRITREPLPDDREDRAARVLEINRTLKGTIRKIGPGSLADLIKQYKQAPEFTALRETTRHEYIFYLDILSVTWALNPLAASSESTSWPCATSTREPPARPTGSSPSCVSSWPSR